MSTDYGNGTAELKRVTLVGVIGFALPLTILSFCVAYTNERLALLWTQVITPR